MFHRKHIQYSSFASGRFASGIGFDSVRFASGQTVDISYTVTNGGNDPARGAWTDSLFLSKDENWDLDDPFIGNVEQNRELAAGTSYTGMLSARLPAVIPGSYRVLLRTDIRDLMAETDERNNASFSSLFSADVPSLTLGVATNGTMLSSVPNFYKVTVQAGETLVIEVDSASTTGYNRALRKLRGDPQSQTDPTSAKAIPLPKINEFVIPVTKAGTYYISDLQSEGRKRLCRFLNSSEIRPVFRIRYDVWPRRHGRRPNHCHQWCQVRSLGHRHACR